MLGEMRRFSDAKATFQALQEIETYSQNFTAYAAAYATNSRINRICLAYRIDLNKNVLRIFVNTEN